MKIFIPVVEIVKIEKICTQRLEFQTAFFMIFEVLAALKNAQVTENVKTNHVFVMN